MGRAALLSKINRFSLCPASEPAPIPCLGRVFLPARDQAPFLLSKTKNPKDIYRSNHSNWDP